MKHEVNTGAGHELAGLLGRIQMIVIKENIARWLDVESRQLRAFQVKMMPLDVGFDPCLLETERIQVPRVNQATESKPDREEKRDLEPRPAVLITGNPERLREAHSRTI